MGKCIWAVLCCSLSINNPEVRISDKQMMLFQLFIAWTVLEAGVVWKRKAS